MNFSLCYRSSFVTITKWIRDGFAMGVETNIVYGPAVYSDGGDAFWRNLSALAQTFFNASIDVTDIPAQGRALLYRSVRKTMHNRDLWHIFHPTQQRNPATLRS